MTTGKDLRIERVRADVKVQDLARAMGVSRTTLWTIEKSASPLPDQVVAVRAALARLSAERAA